MNSRRAAVNDNGSGVILRAELDNLLRARVVLLRADTDATDG